MPQIRSTVFALLAALPLAVPALAQQAPNPLGAQTGISNPYPFSLTVVSPAGKMSVLPIDKAMADKIMKEAKPLTTGVMLLTVNGKTYMASDMKMADGKSMVDWFEVLGTYRHED
jgi:hypothetical protein